MRLIMNKRFQILSLSGGGFRGLYTAKFIADIEEEIKAPIATKFDLIAGTSIGGILALALALEIPAQKIVDLFVEHGEEIFKKRWWSWFGLWKSKYSSTPLADLLLDDALFGQKLLAHCKHPVIVPAINYSSGNPVLFKTSHNPKLTRDHKHSLVNISLATSAAPSYFPRHSFNSHQYVDGGLFANAPALLALHEAEIFLGQESKDIHLLSIGTMSSRFTVDPRKNRNGGTYDWGGINPANTPQKLFGLSISVQETLTNKMVEHRLKDRYLHIDDDLSDANCRAVALDKADKFAQEVLLGAAIERSKYCLGNSTFKEFMLHNAQSPVFYNS